MILRVLPVLLLYTALSIGQQVNREILDDKISNPPLWVTEQIEWDFRDYKKITKEHFEKTYQQYKNQYGFNRLTIKDNQVIPDKKKTGRGYYTYTYNLLKWCSAYVKFPDVDLIMCTLDRYDTKRFLPCPIFAYCKKMNSPSLVLFPEKRKTSALKNPIAPLLKAPQVAWEDKIEKALWRGRTIRGGRGGAWQRIRLVNLAKNRPDLIDAGFNAIKTANISLKKTLKKAPSISPLKQRQYKYLVAVDGISFPSSFYWQLFSKSLVFKQKSPFIEWFYRALKPNEHYISYQNNLDLISKIEWAKQHDIEAQKIAENAYDFSINNLLLEDIIAYFYHLFTKYSQLQELE